MRKLNEMIVKSGGYVYREMISVFLFSAVSSLVLVPVIFLLPIGVALAVLPLIYAPLVAGVFHACYRVVSGERPRLKDVFEGALRFFLPAVGFGLLCALFVLILASTWWFYGSKDSMWSWALAIFQSYFVAMFFVSQVYTLPLIVQERESLFRAVGRSVKLTVTHPGYTFGAFVQVIALTVLLGLTVVGFAFLFTGTLGIYANLITRNLLQGPEEEQDDRKELQDSWTLQGRQWPEDKHELQGAQG
ncbi:hypothetical protein RAC89_08010 [Paenibacillus sp. GD4]|uniref:hypothetical protein n=1 Tax=Paenibacillus sp. GD4 TaxID=3068890 RepID=UPI0027963FCE|nr:hypothetical protein [Paenibacillus sp. GD4]MDQ1910441.1 hypothetical protein [Paenibacillus sp. GD4]